uniref:Sushi domain-containing protein n=1 Tax=Sphaeramia orbicularis TaxID=375764 RepID=A0A673AIW2_9TELE
LLCVLIFIFASAQGPEPPCESPQLQGGFSVIEEDTDSHERKLFYACDDGLKPAVEGWWGTATCQNRTWIPTPQCIDANACIAPEIPNAKYTKSPNGWHEEGHKIRVTCIDGYEDRNHLAIAQCVNGNWTSMPVCERDVHACGPPPKILNAVIIKQVFQKVFLDNSEVEYACEDGYTSNTGAIQKSYCVFGNWTAVSECSGTGATSGHTTSTGGNKVPNVVEKTLKYLKYQCMVCNSDGSWSDPPTYNFCIVDTSRYRNLENIGIQYIKSGDHQEFQCTRSYDTSYGYCEDRQMTFGRCKYRHKLFVICTSKYLMLQLISSGQTD